MSECYVGEIRLLPYMRGAPSGWQVCDGSFLPINQYEVLYQLIGTTYGGDGQTTFAVPDLRSRVPVHQGTGRGLTPRALGETAGGESVTLMQSQMGPHAHMPLASTTPATGNSPANTVLAAIPATLNDTFFNPDAAQSSPVAFPATMIQPAGGSQPHDNTAPTLTMQYCIAWSGVYPAQP
ncbi:phage tail protein [Brevundimonas sp.]|uniref:phage tail protein n=1 Tax=Brevundimonas sp. TaxID=1871086 RepID=UPI003D0E8D45